MGALRRQWTRLLLAASSLFLLLGLAICAPEARSEDCARAHEIETGLKAPCSGVLWPKLWSVEAVTCVEVDLPQAMEAGERAEADATDCARTLKELQSAYEKSLLDVEKIAREAAGLRKQWYESPVLWLGVGLFGGVATAQRSLVFLYVFLALA